MATSSLATLHKTNMQKWDPDPLSTKQTEMIHRLAEEPWNICVANTFVWDRCLPSLYHQWLMAEAATLIAVDEVRYRKLKVGAICKHTMGAIKGPILLPKKAELLSPFAFLFNLEPSKKKFRVSLHEECYPTSHGQTRPKHLFNPFSWLAKLNGSLHKFNFHLKWLPGFVNDRKQVSRHVSPASFGRSDLAQKASSSCAVARTQTAFFLDT